jgi:hypothetical protein
MKKSTAKNGRISVRNRQALKAPVAIFAKGANLKTNLVMSAVLWVGERMGARMSLKALRSLITAETIATYRQELDRRTSYFNAQVSGMIRNSLPAAQRTSENIARVTARIGQHATGLSLPALKTIIESEVAALAEFEAAGA